MSRYLTLEQMVDEAVAIFGDTTTTKKTRARRSIQRGYVSMAQRYPWPQLLTIEDAKISGTAGEKNLYLESYMERVLGVFPYSKTEVLRNESIMSWLKKFAPFEDDSSTGLAVSYTDIGEFAHNVDIDAAAQLILAPGTADDADNSALSYDTVIHGLDSNGREVTVTASVTNGVGVQTTTSFTEVFGFSTDGENADEVRLTNATTMVRIATIPPGERTVKYKKLRLGMTPDTAHSFSVGYKKSVRELVLDDQIPEIPVSDALIHFALATLYRQQRKPGPIAQSEQMLSDSLAQEAFDATQTQGDTFRQARGIERRRFMPGLRRSGSR